MLLLTNILRSRYRGVIHLYPDDAESPPEIELSLSLELSRSPRARAVSCERTMTMISSSRREP